MSCQCNQAPCVCNPCEGETYYGTTLCDLDRKNNVWVEGADANGVGGICLLDTIEECQLTYVLQRDPVARVDLKKVTSNEYLRNLADTIPMLPTTIEGDVDQKTLNQNTLVLHTVFRGVPPFNQ